MQHTQGNAVGKGWGADAAKLGRADKVRRLKAIEARGGMTAGDQAAHEHYLRAWRKFTNLQERSNSGRKISPMRSRSFAPLEHQLPAYGGRTGSNWEFDGNKRVRKSLYQREERLSPIGAATTAAAGVLGIYGLGHSKYVGRQIARGIKVARYDGNQRAVDALMRAQAARGSIRAGMAPGEVALRRIRAVDHAISLVPKPIRGEVALSAGLLMGYQSPPVRHRSYERAW